MIFIKKYIVFLTVLFLFISGNIVCVNAGADVAVGITINGEIIETDVSPFVENGRTLVPARAVSDNQQPPAGLRPFPSAIGQGPPAVPA